MLRLVAGDIGVNCGEAWNQSRRGLTKNTDIREVASARSLETRYPLLMSTPPNLPPPRAVPAPDAQLLLSAIVDSSDDAIVSKTVDGIITSWNHGAERIFGYSKEEAIGRPVRILLPPDRQARKTGSSKRSAAVNAWTI